MNQKALVSTIIYNKRDLKERYSCSTHGYCPVSAHQ